MPYLLIKVAVEELSPSLLGGFPLILLGCALATRRSPPRSTHPSEEHQVPEPART